MEKTKVLVVEDDAFTRSTLSATLELEGFLTPDPAGTATNAIESFKKHSHDVLLADLHLGKGPSGIELAWLLRRLDHKLAIVFLTSFEDPRLHREKQSELPPGALYLVKQDLADRSQISKALREALNVSLLTFKGLDIKRLHPGLQQLTDIQIETLKLLSQGHSNSEIANLRQVSEKAVEQTVRKIAEQLNIEAEKKNLRVILANQYSRYTGGKL